MPDAWGQPTLEEQQARASREMADAAAAQAASAPDPNRLNGWWGQSRDAYDADVAFAQGEAARSRMEAEEARAGALRDRGYQEGITSRLQDRAAGIGPSLSGLQFNAGLGASMAAQRDASATGAGGSMALAGRNAAGGAGTARGQFAGQTAQGGLQERMGAEGVLGTNLGAMRADDAELRAQDLGREALYYGGEHNVKGSQLGEYAQLYGADRGVAATPSDFDRGLALLGAAGQTYSAYNSGRRDNPTKQDGGIIRDNPYG